MNIVYGKSDVAGRMEENETSRNKIKQICGIKAFVGSNLNLNITRFPYLPFFISFSCKDYIFACAVLCALKRDKTRYDKTNIFKDIYSLATHRLFIYRVFITRLVTCRIKRSPSVISQTRISRTKPFPKLLDASTKFTTRNFEPLDIICLGTS